MRGRYSQRKTIAPNTGKRQKTKQGVGGGIKRYPLIEKNEKKKPMNKKSRKVDIPRRSTQRVHSEPVRKSTR
jgi:hypothetical protein